MIYINLMMKVKYFLIFVNIYKWVEELVEEELMKLEMSLFYWLQRVKMKMKK